MSSTNSSAPTDAESSAAVPRGAARPGRRVDAAVLSAGVAASVALLVAVIGIGRSFGYDEGYTYHFFINGGSVRRALTTQVVFNNHPMFSAIQAVAWRLGLVGETAQRLGPALCGAATVGIVAWIVARRAGVVAASTAAAVLLFNPVYLEQVRQLRGYALAALGVLVAVVAMHHSVGDQRRRWLWLQGVAMVVAVTTHSYSAVTLSMIAVAMLALGRVRREHVITWATSAVVALAIMAPILDDMRRNAETRGNRYAPDFPVDLGRALLGWQRGAVAITALLVVIGAVSIARRSRRHLIAVTAAGSVLGLAVLALWQMIQPFDLYFRFFVSVIPLVAVVAGVGAGILPVPLRAATGVAVIACLIPGARDIVDDEPTLRDAAAVVDRARALDLEVCGRNAEPLRVYTAPVPLISGQDGFGDCEVWVTVLRVTGEVRTAAEQHFGARTSIGGGVQVYAPADVLDVIVADE